MWQPTPYHSPETASTCAMGTWQATNQPLVASRDLARKARDVAVELLAGREAPLHLATDAGTAQVLCSRQDRAALANELHGGAQRHPLTTPTVLTRGTRLHLH
jgi:hypothetical protein